MLRSFTIAVMLLALTGAGSMAAAPRRRAVPVLETVSVSFVPLKGGLDGGTLDVGRVAWSADAAGPRRSVVRSAVGVRVDRSGSAAGTAALLAYLSMPDPRCRFRVDGILLGAIPVVIDPAARVGSAVPHRIEIEVPVDEPEGPINGTITWQATLN